MRIYIAGRWSRRAEFRRYARHLEAHGHVVTSRWLAQRTDAKSPAKARAEAERDLADVLRSDVLLAFTEPSRTNSRGGRFCELGAALATGIQVHLVGGHVENVFSELVPVQNRHGCFSEFSASLSGRRIIKCA